MGRARLHRLTKVTNKQWQKRAERQRMAQDSRKKKRELRREERDRQVEPKMSEMYCLEGTGSGQYSGQNGKRNQGNTEVPETAYPNWE